MALNVIIYVVFVRDNLACIQCGFIVSSSSNVVVVVVVANIDFFTNIQCLKLVRQCLQYFIEIAVVCVEQ